MIVLFPTNLFENSPILGKNKIILLEHPLFFTKYKYHKLKLILHRSSMRYYYNYLKENGYDVKYINFNEDYSSIFSNDIIEIYDPVDYELELEFKTKCKKLVIHETPLFLTSRESLIELYNTNPKTMHSGFYIFQRKKLNVLIENDLPEGGEWDL